MNGRTRKKKIQWKYPCTMQKLLFHQWQNNEKNVNYFGPNRNARLIVVVFNFGYKKRKKKILRE